MINIDTRLLSQINPDELYLVCHIVNYMNQNKMCFPSNAKLNNDSGFSQSKILRVKNSLVDKKIMTVTRRFRTDGSQTSNLYKLQTEYIGVFVSAKNMSDLDTTPFTDEEGEVFTHEEGTPSAMNTQEVLANRSINNIKVLKDCEMPFTPIKTKIKNSFTRQSILDSISHEQGFKEKEKSTREKEKESREPSQTYLCFTAFASTYERLAGVTYPSDKNNYIMTAKDGANCKKLVTWLKKVSASEQAPDDMVIMFTTAAWQISDKWLKANFTISNIYSQANNIYTKFMYSNPAAQEKRRQEEIERLVNEYQP
jgi:hypothetical protein